MALETEQKRRFSRVRLTNPVRYQVRGRPECTNAVCDNISEGGLSFTNSAFIPKSTPVMLQFKVLSRMLTAIGKVAWAMPLPYSDRFRLGFEFIEIEPAEKAFLAEYVEMRKEHTS